MDKGYVKLYRCLLQNPIVCKDAEHLAVWCYLLLKATHTECDVIFAKERTTLKPGQLITGRKKISQALNVSESKVQRILKLLENEHQIEQRTNSQNRLISIVNWQLYQNSEQQTERQVNNERTTSEQRVNTNKNDKNDKNVKNDKKNIYGDFFNQLWQMYPIKKGKGSVSDTQKKKLYAIGLEEMTRAITRYCEGNKNTEKKYWKHGSTFFNSGYIDYLDENYEDKPCEEEQKGSESDYDYDNFYIN